MNINMWTPVMHEQRIADLRVQYANVKKSRHLSDAVKTEKLKSLARKGKSHATRLRGFNVTVQQNVMEYPTTGLVEGFNGARYNGSIAWGSQIG